MRKKSETTGLKTRSKRQHRKVDYTLGMCYRCNGIQDFEMDGKRQFILKCVDCHRNVHPSCSGLSQASAEIVKAYDWQCNDCKSCLVCHSKNDEDKIVFCSNCDRGYHIFCCQPALKSVPKDDWYCSLCTNMPSPSSLPSPTSSDIPQLEFTNENANTIKVNTLTPPPMDDPLTPLSDINHNQQHSTGYRLRPSPTHSLKFIENASASLPATTTATTLITTMTRQPRKKKTKDDMKHSQVTTTTIVDETSSIKKRGRKKPLPEVEEEEENLEIEVDDNNEEIVVEQTKKRKRRKSPEEEEGEQIEVEEQVESVTKRRRKHSSKNNEEPKLKLRLTINKDTTSKKEATQPTIEYNEEFYKTFGNKLTMAEADTKRGTPTELDREKFEKAKLKAEKMKSNKIATEINSKRKSSSSHQQQQQQQSDQEGDDDDEGDAGSSKDKWKPKLDIPKINTISFGDYLIDTWYVAPYPEEYSQSSTLYICEFCMKYMKSGYVAGRHRKKCAIKHPPGDEIYRDGKISIFEVDGRKNKIYCQHLCLMAKMFLDHKTLYYDVEPFLFYIMTEADEKGCHFVGYFSKEKCSAMNYNVSCILTMPTYQRKGYGQFLIDFSYLLSKKENKTGTPERPLSDLGLLSYRSYWKSVLFRKLADQSNPISIEEMSIQTSLTPDDIISTLQISNMIRFDDEAKHYVFTPDAELIQSYLDELDNKKAYIRVNPKKLTWTPFVLSRDRLAVMMGQAKLTIKNGDESSDVEVT